MNRWNRRGGWMCSLWRGGLRVMLSVAVVCFGLPREAGAICGLDAGFTGQVRVLEDPGAREAWAGWLARRGVAACSACHVAGYGPRNPYGSAMGVLLSGRDRDDESWKREAGRRVGEIPAIPPMDGSPTFGELIRRGLPPAADDATELPAGQVFAAMPAETITPAEAREAVARAEADSRFGILQFSRVEVVDAEVAAVLAGFRGEFLILGLKKLTPEVARALAASRAATVWLHSLTSVEAEAAEAMALLRGQLVMSGLVELESLPLARKLAQRPGVLSLPYLQRVSTEIAAALGENKRGLQLAGVTELSAECEAALAASAAPLSLPGLHSLRSLPLTEKLAAGYASSVRLPRLAMLTVEQARVVARSDFGVFWGGIALAGAAMTEEVAAVFAEEGGKRLLTLGGSDISGAALRMLAAAPFPLELPEIEVCSAEQARILAEAVGQVEGGPIGFRAKPGMPGLRTLDPPELAVALLRSAGSFAGAGNFAGIREISAEVAAAVARTTDAEASGKPLAAGLVFPGLEVLSEEAARLLAARPWGRISFPSLRQVSPEAVRLLARQTSNLELGLSALTPEVASALGEMGSDPVNLGGGLLTLSGLNEVSPEAARSLVNALNRGKEVTVPTGRGFDRAPQLFIGGRLPGSFGPPLTAAVVAELAAYRGRLSINGIRELPRDAAAALAAYQGPMLDLAGPGIETLEDGAADALAGVSVRLNLELRVLDSVLLADRFRRRGERLDDLESISADAIASLVPRDGFFTLRRLTVLDSPALAARLTADSSGQVLPSLQRITPPAAEVLVTSPNKVLLGLRFLDDPAVAEILTRSAKGVSLPRLRAATPEVAAILRKASSIEAPLLAEGGEASIAPPNH